MHIQHMCILGAHSEFCFGLPRQLLAIVPHTSAPALTMAQHILHSSLGFDDDDERREKIAEIVLSEIRGRDRARQAKPELLHGDSR